jgi:hypothetical protein
VVTIPVKPGRNLAVIIEVAAMNNRQKRMGHNAAQGTAGSARHAASGRGARRERMGNHFRARQLRQGRFRIGFCQGVCRFAEKNTIRYSLDAPMADYTSFRIGGPADILLSR